MLITQNTLNDVVKENTMFINQSVINTSNNYIQIIILVKNQIEDDYIDNHSQIPTKIYTKLSALLLQDIMSSQKGN